MPRWLVGLKGDPFDVNALERAARNLRYEIVWEKDQPFLHCPETNNWDDYKAAINNAKNVLHQLNDYASLEFLDHKTVEYSGNTHRHHESGKIDRVLSCGTGRGRLRGFPADLGNRREPTPSEMAATVAQHHPEVSNALRRFRQKPTNWTNLVATLEIVAGNRNISNTLTHKGLARHAEINRFINSSNDPALGGDLARHGVSDRKRKLNGAPMTLQEGAAFVQQVLKKWIIDMYYHLDPRE